MSTKAIIVNQKVYKLYSQLRNEMKKPHEDSDNYVIETLVTSYRNRSQDLQDEIEDKEFSVGFPN